jgi:hypothetical protein
MSVLTANSAGSAGSAALRRLRCFTLQLAMSGALETRPYPV